MDDQSVRTPFRIAVITYKRSLDRAYRKPLVPLAPEIEP